VHALSTAAEPMREWLAARSLWDAPGRMHRLANERAAGGSVRMAAGTEGVPFRTAYRWPAGPRAKQCAGGCHGPAVTDRPSDITPAPTMPIPPWSWRRPPRSTRRTRKQDLWR